MATWTVVYHVCLVARLGVRTAVVLEVLALAACGVWWVRRWRSRETTAAASAALPTTPGASSFNTRAGVGGRLRTPQVSRVLLWLTVVVAAIAAVAMAVDATWPLVATSWLVAAVLGSAWAFLDVWTSAEMAAAAKRPTPNPATLDQATVDPAPVDPAPVDPAPVDPAPVDPAPVDPASVDPAALEPQSAIVALVWAVALAVLTLCLLRPNPDDVYYVNLSQWVTDHGTFPLRDTIFSNQVYPMSSWPPMASYDALAGTVARLVDIRAAAVVYIVAPPIVTALSVLALWRLLRAWRVRAVSVALSSALIFLLLDGASKHAPGTLFVSRLWQAKVVFLCVMVPVLLVYAVRYVERPSRERAGWLFVGGVAAVGVTTSAMFLVPLIAIAGAAPLVPRSTRRALIGFAAMAVYPLAAGVVTKAVGGRSADDFAQGEIRFDPAWFGHQVFHDGVVAVLGVGAVLLGALIIPNRFARVTTGLLAVLVGITFIPGFTHLSFDVVGLGPTLWRMSWLVTVAGLVGVAATRVTERWSTPTLRSAGPVGLTVLLVVFSDPIWSGATSTTWDAPFHYQREPETVLMANRVIRGSQRGDVVMAPSELSLTITVLTTRIHSVDPRGYFMNYLRDDKAFQYSKRVALSNFVNDIGSFRPAAIKRDLMALSVDVVCLNAPDTSRIRRVARWGYRPTYRSGAYRCLTRPRADSSR
jgi:hypothetical protein